MSFQFLEGVPQIGDAAACKFVYLSYGSRDNPEGTQGEVTKNIHTGWVGRRENEYQHLSRRYALSGRPIFLKF